MTTEASSWPMWAGQRPRKDDTEPMFCDVGTNARYAQMHGHETPIAVIVTEDPDGPYWGWLSNQNHDRTHAPVYEKTPCMIYEREGLLNMCFPAGYMPEAERNAGRMVRLSITHA